MSGSTLSAVGELIIHSRAYVPVNPAKTKTELTTRRDVVLSRLTAAFDDGDVPSDHKLRTRFDELTRAIDGMLNGPVFEADKPLPKTLSKAVNDVDYALNELNRLAGEATVVAEPIVARKAKKIAATAEFEAALAAQGAKMSKAINVLSPDNVDTDARDAHNEIRSAYATPAFVDTRSSDEEFDAIVAFAKGKMDTVTANVDAKATEAAIKGPILAALAAAEARQQGLKLETPLAAIGAAVAATLTQTRNDLRTAKGIAVAQAAVTALAAADAEQARMALLEQAARSFEAAAAGVAAVSQIADPTPKTTLGELWATAQDAAVAALRDGCDATGLLDTVTLRANGLSLLTGVANGLRTRGDKVAKQFKEYGGRFSKDQVESIGNHGALIGKLADIADEETSIALDAKLAETERRLTTAIDAWTDFDRLRNDLLDQTRSLARVRTINPAEAAKAEINAAEKLRLTKHAAGDEKLKRFEARIVLYCEVASEAAAVDQSSIALKGLGVTSQNSDTGTWMKKATDTLTDFSKPIDPALPGDLQNYRRVLDATMAYSEARRPLENAISAATRIGGASKNITDELGAISRLANEGKVQEVVERMKALPAALAQVKTYAEQGKPTYDEALKLKPRTRQLGNLLDGERGKVTKALVTLRYADAIDAAKLLGPLLAPLRTMDKAYVDADQAVSSVTGLNTPATKAENAKEDAVFARRLADTVKALTANSALLTALTATLEELQRDAERAIDSRRSTAKAGIEDGPLGKDGADALFSDIDAARHAARLYADLEPSAFTKMFAAVAGGEADIGKRKAALAKAAKQLGPIGGEKLAMLGQQLGDEGHVGRLCGADGGASLPKGLAEKFSAAPERLGKLMDGAGKDIDRFSAMVSGSAERADGLATQFGADPTQLRSLMQDGLGDDLDDIGSVFMAAGRDGKQIKALSDKFANRNDLQTVITNVKRPAADRKPGTVLKSLADRHYGGEWAKLKTKFFDTLSADPDGTRLMEVADDFTCSSPSGSVPNKHGFVDIDLAHTQKRHTPACFDFGDIKDANGQFKEANRKDVAAISSAAAGEVRKSINAVASTAVCFDDTPSYTKYQVVTSGLTITVGYNKVTSSIDQVFPTGASADQFSEGQMKALKTAFGR